MLGELEKYWGGGGGKGFGVFNKVLLGKWVWRFLVKGEGLWIRVLKSLYCTLDVGESGIVPMGRLGRGSTWWKDIIENIVGKGGKWMWENLERRIGNGEGTSFWENRWADG